MNIVFPNTGGTIIGGDDTRHPGGGSTHGGVTEHPKPETFANPDGPAWKDYRELESAFAELVRRVNNALVNVEARLRALEDATEARLKEDARNPKE